MTITDTTMPDIALGSAIDQSQIAFAYFDMSDRLRYWNRAYEDLNYRIKPMIQIGACFPDLLEELVQARDRDVLHGDLGGLLTNRVGAGRLARALRGVFDLRVGALRDVLDVRQQPRAVVAQESSASSDVYEHLVRASSPHAACTF